MEALSTMNILYTDKTGTLTYGDFQVVDYHLDQELLKKSFIWSNNPVTQSEEQLFLPLKRLT